MKKYRISTMRITARNFQEFKRRAKSSYPIAWRRRRLAALRRIMSFDCANEEERLTMIIEAFDGPWNTGSSGCH